MSVELQQAEELGRLKADVRILLEQIEWNGHADLFQCPSCSASQVAGHEKNCRLAAVQELTKKARNAQ